MNELWPWLAIALLGAFHGLNPAMGWLFAVALGLQERSRRAVVRAFAPIALGHAASVGGVVALVWFAEGVLSLQMLQLASGGALLAFGLYKLLAPMSHPRWVGMKVNFRDLTSWSLLMATAHGAGLMLMPALLRLGTDGSSHLEHGAHAGHDVPGSRELLSAAAAGVPVAEIGAVAIHTLAMLLVMAGIALVVFEKVGLLILRRAWFNMDRVWALALLVTGLLVLLF